MIESTSNSYRSSFATTQWSIVVAAGGATDDSSAQAALEMLCRAYWPPLFAFVRRKGYNRSDAEDLVQGFFARIIKRNDIASVKKDKGRFRSYLLSSMKNFLVNEWRRCSAEKRGSQRIVEMDEDELAKLNSRAKSDSERPDVIYDRQWALSLLGRVLDRLGDEWKTNGKGELFEAFRGFLVEGAGDTTQAEIGEKFSLSEGAVKQTLFRLRRRYQLLVREEIAATVATTDEIDSELRYLVAALRAGSH